MFYSLALTHLHTHCVVSCLTKTKQIVSSRRWPRMAGLKYTLQKDVFDGEDERILSLCRVTDIFKKKKVSYLVIVASQKTPSSSIGMNI